MADSAPCPVPHCTGVVRVLQQGLWGCDGPEQHGDGTIRDYAVALLDEPDTDLDAIERRLDPLHWRREAIAKATNGEESSDYAPRPPESMLAEPPEWPSALKGLAPLRGLAVFSGKSSSGKTAAALPSAMEAALAGWNVMYLAAEAPSVVRNRAMQWCRGRGLPAWPERFDLRYTPPDMTLERFQKAVTKFAVTDRTLVVLDSINSLVDSFVTDDDVHGIGPLKRLAMWMMRVRQYTQGEVSFLVLSEANASGETKGRALDHKADISVNFEKGSDDWTVKKVFVVKNWWGVPGPVGDFEYDTQRACLHTHAELAAMDNASRRESDEDAFDGQEEWWHE